MRAIQVDPARGTLETIKVPDPQPAPNEVVIRIHSAGINRADLLARSGSYSTSSSKNLPPPTIAGLELAGEIIARGKRVRNWEIGSRVMTIGQGYAQLACVDESLLIPVPSSFTWEEAGAMPIALLTAHNALVTNGRLSQGESVLIQAVTSGVGTMALVIADLLEAQPIFGTSRSPQKLGQLTKKLIGINLLQDDTAEVIAQQTNGSGVNVIIDNIGASVLTQNIASAAIRGRIVQVGRLGGATAELDLEEVARKRLTLTGVTFRTRTLQERAEIVRSCLEDIGEALADGMLRPVVEKSFPFEQAEYAQDVLSRNDHVGKLVLTIT